MDVGRGGREEGGGRKERKGTDDREGRGGRGGRRGKGEAIQPAAVMSVQTYHWSRRSWISSSPLVMTLTLLIMCTTSPERGGRNLRTAHSQCWPLAPPSPCLSPAHSLALAHLA